MSEGSIDRVWRYKPTAESLGISTKTLQRLVARGEIATVQITDRIRGITRKRTGAVYQVARHGWCVMLMQLDQSRAHQVYVASDIQRRAVMSGLPDEAIRFIEAVTAHFGAPEAVTFRNNSNLDGAFMNKKFDDTNRGVLFRDENKSKPEDRDYSGSVNIAGTEHWLSGWIKVSKKGTKFLSLSVKPKAPVEAKPVPFNDEIEF
jgi:hypothetical protein